MIVAQVEAGQTLKKYYEPWAVLDGTGKILSSHCTCMAGLGEACSHIAAILFAIETTIKLGLNKPSCTSVPCKWKAVMQKVKPSEVAAINFSRPSLKKRDNVYDDVARGKKTCVLPNFSEDKKKIHRKRMLAVLEKLRLFIQ
ncbi:hypothetical protein JTE90_026927 [Oedothorax gibbosus]|uniref:SWIM-type domain-containing protein n=1 Tax=Oedothorax gibbosus TaxID=931172 RepID=A0AAV6TW00_9ARAC|nr:hypothetical protein JTE90_026927 [Oedothorax gibbosus]